MIGSSFNSEVVRAAILLLSLGAGAMQFSCGGPVSPSPAQQQATRGSLVDLLELVQLTDPEAASRADRSRGAIDARRGTVAEYRFDGQRDKGGGETEITLQPEVDRSTVQRLRLRLRLIGGEYGAECRLQWSGGSLQFPCKPDRLFHTYTMEVGNQSGWGESDGPLTLQFIGAGAGVEIEFIRFEAGLSAEVESLLRAEGGLPGTVELDEDYRPAMLVPPGEDRTVSLVVPSGADPCLALAVGVSRQGWVDGGNPVRFQVQASGRFGISRTILDLTLDPVNDVFHRTWQDRRVSLARFAGQEIRLTFSVEDAGEGTGSAAAAVWANPVLEPDGDRRTSVMVILVDTLRSDHLGCYGHMASVSPVIDRWSRRGELWRDVVSSSCWTARAVASLFTGRHAYDHGVLSMEMLGLDRRFETLAELFAAGGYSTAAVSYNLLIIPENGFAQGFGSFVTKPWNSLSRGAREISDLGRRWLAINSHRYFFLYLHYMDPHGEYEPETPFRSPAAEDGAVVRDVVERGALSELTRRLRNESGFQLNDAEQRRLLELYDAEITATDFHVGRLLAWMEQSGLLETTLVVLLADHGEGFGEHGFYSHANTLHREEVSLPLLIIPPSVGDGASGVRGETLRMVDLAETIAVRAGLPSGEPTTGDGAEVICEMSPYAVRPTTPAPVPAVRSVRLGPLKLIHDPARDEYRLYDLARDPGERRNIFDPDDPRAAGLLDSLRQLHETAAAADLGRKTDTPAPDAVQLQQLEALGYLDR